jgi:hypothetical protein
MSSSHGETSLQGEDVHFKRHAAKPIIGAAPRSAGATLGGPK